VLIEMPAFTNANDAAAVAAAKAAGASVVSMSFGAPEDSGETGANLLCRKPESFRS
jgi:hypothetical protein